MTPRLLGAAAAMAGVIVATAALYHYGAEFVMGRSGQRPDLPTQVAQNAPTVSSDSFELSFLDQPRAVPELRFTDGEGRELSLTEFHGRAVVLNIWATWCVPCRTEMPSLDRLQAAFDKEQLTVLPLSIDRKGIAVVKPFYEELGLHSLGIYVDQSGKAANALNAVGVPTTLLIDPQGREVARKIGPAEWDSPGMTALIREHLALPQPGQKANP